MFFPRGSIRGKNCFSSVDSTESGNFECRKLSTSLPSSEEFDFSIEPSGISRSRTTAVFLQNWEKLTSDPFILNTFQGFQIPFLSEPSQVTSPHLIPMSSEQKLLVDQEVQEMLKKEVIKPAHSS